MAYELEPGMKATAKEPTGASANGKARGGVYTTDHGIFGTSTFALAWHQQKQEVHTVLTKLSNPVITY